MKLNKQHFSHSHEEFIVEKQTRAKYNGLVDVVPFW